MKKLLGIVVLCLLTMYNSANSKVLTFTCHDEKLPKGSFNYFTRVIDTNKGTVTIKHQYSPQGIQANKQVYNFEPSPKPFMATFQIYKIDNKKIEYGRTNLEFWKEKYLQTNIERWNTNNPKKLKKLIKKNGDPSLTNSINTWNYSKDGDVSIQGFLFNKKWYEPSPSGIACFSEMYVKKKKKEQIVKASNQMKEEIEPFKEMCRNIGYTDGTNKFADCVKDLYLKKLDAENLTQSQTTTTTTSKSKRKIDPSVWDDLLKLGGIASGSSGSSSSSSSSSLKSTCYNTGEETVGLNKSCKYSCSGSIVTTTISALEICAIHIQR